MRERKLTLFERIMRADARGTGMQLSADDVFALASEDQIQRQASFDAEDAGRKLAKGRGILHD